jgi:hypothetical protein
MDEFAFRRAIRVGVDASLRAATRQARKIEL